MKKIGAVIHLGIVVPSLEKALTVYRDKFGITDWEMADKMDFFSDKLVNGEIGIDFRNAIHRGEDVEIELIEPTVDSIFKTWLEEHGPGIHHVKFATEMGYSELMEISGKAPYLEIAWPDKKAIVGYADFLEDAGVLIELSNND
ncbi:VOC family protein [Streptococcus henryi]|uniref:VOC family protein n=1 Tax=Streptococcus henryi TaxID=439219 RepID=UPI0003764414|nr:VOC family protein [Streptococcus henryi]